MNYYKGWQLFTIRGSQRYAARRFGVQICNINLAALRKMIDLKTATLLLVAVAMGGCATCDRKYEAYLYSLTPEQLIVENAYKRAQVSELRAEASEQREERVTSAIERIAPSY